MVYRGLYGQKAKFMRQGLIYRWVTQSLSRRATFFMSVMNNSSLNFDGLCGLHQISHVEIKYWMHRSYHSCSMHPATRTVRQPPLLPCYPLAQRMGRVALAERLLTQLPSFRGKKYESTYSKIGCS